MKGRSNFSPGEADRVRELLRKVRNAARDEQKQLRSRLRTDVGFFISDFTSSNAGFTADDFDDLIRQGTVTVTEREMP